MKRIGRKTRANRGETIAETLVAILIACIALVMLAGMITTSTDLIQKNRSQLEKYYRENNELNAFSTSTVGSVGVYSVNGNTSNTRQLTDALPDTGSVSVYFAQNTGFGDSDDAMAYKIYFS